MTSEGKVMGTLRLGGQEPFFWEPHIALAVPVQEKQEITVHFGRQGPSGLQEKLASVLGIPQHRVIVKVTCDTFIFKHARGSDVFNCINLSVGEWAVVSAARRLGWACP